MTEPITISNPKYDKRFQFIQMIMEDDFLNEMQRIPTEQRQRRYMISEFARRFGGKVSENFCRAIQKACIYKTILGGETLYGFKNFDINFDKFLEKPTYFIEKVILAKK